MATGNKVTFELTAVDKASRVFQNVGKEMDKVTKKSEKQTKSLQKWGTALVGIGTSIGYVMKKSVDRFIEFERGLSHVEAITRATGDEMARLKDLAMEMGSTTKFTAKEATDAMKFLGMAGFNTVQIMEALPSSLSLAAAGALELGESADIMSNVLTGFRLQAEESSRVADVLALTAATANTDIRQLGEAFKYLAPSAAAMGISLEEASAVIGIMGNAGLQGSLATRALSTSMTRLAKNPTGDMEEAMKAVGLQAFDVTGKFVGMKELIRQLEVGMEGMTDKQKQNILVTIFGAEAMQEMNIMLAAGSEKIGEYTKELEGANGAASKMATTMEDNLGGSIIKMQSAIDGFMIQLGEQLGPTIKQTVDEITTWINNNLNNKQTIDEISSAIQAMIGILKFLWTVISTTIEGWRRLFGVIQPLVEAALTYWYLYRDRIISTIKLTINRFRSSYERLFKFIPEMTVKIIDTITKTWEGGMEGIKNIIVGTFEVIRDTINGIIDGLAEKIMWLVNKVTGAFNTIKSTLSGIGTKISNVGSSIRSGLGMAKGGIVPGYANGGTISGTTDTVPIMATPGEVILNAAQQKNLVGQLKGRININVSGNNFYGDDKRFAEKVGDEIIKQFRQHYNFESF